MQPAPTPHLLGLSMVPASLVSGQAMMPIPDALRPGMTGVVQQGAGNRGMGCKKGNFQILTGWPFVHALCVL